MIPLFKPFVPELPNLHSIMHSGNLAYGEHTKKFENLLRSYFDADYLLTVSSYGLAIPVAVKALGLIAGDEIIMSPMACLVSTQPYACLGLKIKWCDVDNRTGTLDPQCLRKAITEKTKLIVHNHFCGYPGYVDEVNAIGDEFGIPVLDDGIESFGSLYKEKRIGNCGSCVTVFSLSATRLLNTVEGGIIIFNKESLFKKALTIRDCGIDRTKFRDELGEISDVCDILNIGYSAMMSNVNAYIGIEQMKYIDKLLKKQRMNAKSWDSYFKSQTDCVPIVAYQTSPNYWVYGVLAHDKKDFIQQFREKGYYASGVHTNNSKYTVFGNSQTLPGAKDFNEHFVGLPCGWWMD